MSTMASSGSGEEESANYYYDEDHLDGVFGCVKWTKGEHKYIEIVVKNRYWELIQRFS